MNGLHRLRLSHDPKAGVPALDKARRVAPVVAPEHIVERLQRFEIKLLGFLIIADWNGYVFNHAPNIGVGGAISIATLRGALLSQAADLTHDNEQDVIRSAQTVAGAEVCLAVPGPL